MYLENININKIYVITDWKNKTPRQKAEGNNKAVRKNLVVGKGKWEPEARHKLLSNLFNYTEEI